MKTLPVAPVPRTAYAAAAARHLADGESLFVHHRHANAGQLYGFVAECGLKALLIACGVEADAQGEIPVRDRFRLHLPKLTDRITIDGHLIPDGPKATQYLANLTRLDAFDDWSIDHRYWHESSLPADSFTAWRTAAAEVGEMLDQAKQDGVL